VKKIDQHNQLLT